MFLFLVLISRFRPATVCREPLVFPVGVRDVTKRKIFVFVECDILYYLLNNKCECKYLYSLKKTSLYQYLNKAKHPNIVVQCSVSENLSI